MEEFEKTLRNELGEELQLGALLNKYTSFRVGGPARFFYKAKKIDDLIKAVALAYKLNVPYFILGGGYNIVVSDEGFAGLVIKNECDNIAFSEENSQVIVDSGVALSRLINTAASRDLGGLEFLFGVPGTVGGSVYNNAGAFSYEIKDFVRNVIMLTPKNGAMTVVKKDPKSMSFSYRSSKLKKEAKGKKFPPVILTIKLQLVKRRRDEILDMMQRNLVLKKQNQPLSDFSSGSFFKNTGVKPEQSAGYLLDQAGMKKIKIGGAAISKKHANFIINQNKATASDIKKLAERAKKTVKERFGCLLEEEIEYIGKW